MNNVTPVILCGGSGTRLWPLSRAGFPKQYLVLSGATSLFQQAVGRVSQLGAADITVGSPLIVTNEEHRFLSLEQLREVQQSDSTLLLEPTGRNTAPALTLAALQATEGGADPILVVTPADQTVANTFAFSRAMKRAIKEAASGTTVILGIAPDRPETGYGYIQTIPSLLGQAEAILLVKRFAEKPDATTAQQYLDAGGYFWNAGIFVLKASVWLKSLGELRPDILQATRTAWEGRRKDGYFIRPDEKAFKAIPSESIDYAVMEYAPIAGLPLKMVPLDAGWSDLGAWDAVWEVLPKDVAGNAHVGDVQFINSRNTLVHATSRLVSLVGVDDIIVIETPDAVLVVDRMRSQEVKHIFKTLNDQGREECVLHRKVHRPWGWYDNIDEGEHFKVKRILVNPKASLSLQKHHHRAEHWVVISGTAEIINGDKVLTLTKNQSTFIPLGVIHRLANPDNIPLEIVEVQTGNYLGEDDIVRIEDNYGRIVKMLN